jgi:hypothetical protein
MRSTRSALPRQSHWIILLDIAQEGDGDLAAVQSFEIVSALRQQNII